MKRKIGADAVVLLVLLFVFAGVSLQIAGRDTSGDEGGRPRRSTLSPKPGGWKAAYLLLKNSGIPAARFEKPPREWPDTASVMIAGQEVMAFTGEAYWTSEQAADALAWVERGGTLFVLTGESNAVTDAVGASPDIHKTKGGSVQPSQPVPYLAGVGAVTIPGKERLLKLGKDATVLLGDDKPGAVIVKHGKGHVLVAASPAIIENKTLLTTDNARFFAQTVAAFLDPKRPAGVLWDEYHQGNQEKRTFWNAIGQPGQFAVLQIGVVIALACAASATRFGLPRSEATNSRVSSEYVTSLADLYRRAKATDAALEGVYLSFWRDLCRATGMPLDATAEDVARRAAASLGENVYGATASEHRAKREAKLTALCKECETKIEAGAKNLTSGEMLTLARSIESLRKDLELGRDERND